MCFNALPLDSNVQLKLRTAELEGTFNQWFSTGDMILSDNIQDTWLNFFRETFGFPGEIWQFLEIFFLS